MRLRIVCLATVASIGFLPAMASAQLDGPTVIRGNDTNAADLFGTSVDINNRVIIVGAPGDAPNGSFSGSAYLFDADTSVQLHKLIPSDGSAQDQFGTSVSISGNRAIVGAPNANKVYVFDVVTGQQIRVIQGPGSFGFGEAVDLDGGTAIVGSSPANGFQGAAYLYDIETGQQLFTFSGNGGNFGRSVSIRGDRAAVGASGVNQVVLYDTTSGSFVLNLTSGGATSFGADIDIQVGRIVIGAPGTIGPGGTTAGRISVFDAQSGASLASTPGPSFADGGLVAVNTFGFYATGLLVEPGQGGGSVLNAYSANLLVRGSLNLAVQASSLAAADEFVVVGQQSDTLNGPSAGRVGIFTETSGISLDFISQSPGLVVSEGDQATFSVTVSRDDADFQWRRNGVALSDSGDISGAQTETLVISDATAADMATYDCVVSASGADPITSSPAVLAVLPDPDACLADLNGDGLLNFFDIQAYIGLFGAGCP
jgi:WD40 repeat protein